jgi:hypothetical protein
MNPQLEPSHIARFGVEVPDRDTLKGLIESAYLILVVPKIHLALTCLSRDDLILWQSKIDKYVLACGCKEAMAGTAGLLVVFSVYRWIDPFQNVWSVWTSFLIGFGFAIAGAGIGKIGGHFVARKKLRSTLGELLRALGTRNNG